MPTLHKLVASVGSAALIAAVPAAGYAATHTVSAAKQGTVHVWVTPGNGAVDKILLTGVIGDFGTATSQTKAGKVTQSGNYVKIALRDGTFMVNAVAFGKVANQLKPQLDRSTCTAWGIVSGPVTLYDGTGAYAGISGTVAITNSFAELAPTYQSGPKKGACNFNARRPRDVFNGQITGTGTITV